MKTVLIINKNKLLVIRQIFFGKYIELRTLTPQTLQRFQFRHTKTYPFFIYSPKSPNNSTKLLIVMSFFI